VFIYQQHNPIVKRLLTQSTASQSFDPGWAVVRRPPFPSEHIQRTGSSNLLHSEDGIIEDRDRPLEPNR
jgi:hypothetical protein